MQAQNSIYYESEHYFWKALSSDNISFGNDMQLYIGDKNDQAFNFIYVHLLPIERSFSCALRKMEERQSAYIVAIKDDVFDNIAEYLDFQHLHYDSTTVAMIKDLTETPTDIIDSSIELLTYELNDWLTPLESAFCIDDQEISHQYMQLHKIALLKGYGLYHFVLKINNKVVTSLTLTIHEETVRLDDIGTLLSEQGKGYATRVVNYALSFAKRKGANYCVLEASNEGLSLYKKLGFIQLFEYYNFMYIKNT